MKKLTMAFIVMHILFFAINILFFVVNMRFALNLDRHYERLKRREAKQAVHEFISHLSRPKESLSFDIDHEKISYDELAIAEQYEFDWVDSAPLTDDIWDLGIAFSNGYQYTAEVWFRPNEKPWLRRFEPRWESGQAIVRASLCAFVEAAHIYMAEHNATSVGFEQIADANIVEASKLEKGGSYADFSVIDVNETDARIAITTHGGTRVFYVFEPLKK